MAQRFIFKNLYNQELAYEWELNSDYSSRGRPLCAHARAFQVYNDYPVQHSPSWLVQREDAANYLESLATALVEKTAAHEWPEVFMLHHWPAEPQRKRIEFYSLLQHREGKTVYLNREELRTSTSSTKRHDRRWEEVPAYADGSFESVLRLMWSDTDSLLDSLVRAHHVANWFADRSLHVHNKAIVKFFDLPEDDSVRLRESILAIYSLVQSRYAVQMAEVTVSNLANWRERQQKKAAEAIA